MKTYIYPKNLKAKAQLWLWSLRDFVILAAAALLSAAVLLQSGSLIPAALTLGYGFLSIRLEDTTVLDYMSYAARYVLASQKYYEWR
jgi:hypothetical protein